MSLIQAEPFPLEFDPGTTALVIIDMQRDFVLPGGFGEKLGNDTSLLLATAPGLVRMNKLQPGDGKNGVVGDPRRASAEIGRALIDKTVTRTVAEIRAAIVNARKP